MNAEVIIDGSEGEGGGQIVRSSLSLAIVTRTPVVLENIRAGRARPGLQQQHLTAVRAAAEICSGELTGAEPQSRRVHFVPGPVQPGHYHFKVGTAGSAMLVLQTILPPLLTATGPSTLILEGGTHNQWAPPFDFLTKCYLPLLRRMGPIVNANLNRYGFYPAGGGMVSVEVQPVCELAGFDLLTTGRILAKKLTALISQLPDHIAEREISRALRKLNWPGDAGGIQVVGSSGPGNVLFTEIVCEHITEVITAFGRRGVRAEKVAGELVRDISRWQMQDVPVGEHLADQILLPLGLSAAQHANCGVRRGGRFRTGPLSRHCITHIDILKRFLNICVDTNGTDSVEVTVRPAEAM